MFEHSWTVEKINGKRYAVHKTRATVRQLLAFLATPESVSGGCGFYSPGMAPLGSSCLDMLSTALASPSETSSGPWFGITPQDWVEATQTGGVQRITDRMRAASASLANEGTSSMLTRSNVGAWDVGAVLAGQSMPAMRRERRPSPPVALDVFMALSWRESPDVLADWSARAARAITKRTLERGRVLPRLRLLTASKMGDTRESTKDVLTAMSGALGFKVSGFIQDHAIAFDPANLHETAFVLSPSFVRALYRCEGNAYCSNPTRVPATYRNANTAPNSLLLDVYHPSESAASIEKFLK